MNKYDAQSLVRRPDDRAVNDNPYDLTSFRAGRAITAERREKSTARVIAMQQYLSPKTHQTSVTRIPLEELFLPAEP